MHALLLATLLLAQQVKRSTPAAIVIGAVLVAALVFVFLTVRARGAREARRMRDGEAISVERD